MTNHCHLSLINGCWRAAAVMLGMIAIPAGHAQTLWTGPDMKFTQSSTARSDTILAGKVVLTRGSMKVLYNSAAGEKAAGDSSPADTEWAFGALSDAATLSYQSLSSMRDGNLRALILNQPMVMHVISEDIYVAVKFTAWGSHGSGGFAYTRSTPAVAAAPTVSLLSPSPNAIFAAPASFSLTADASVSGGTVSKVEYFAGPSSLGASTASPFAVTGTITNAGVYPLTAVATAGGVSSTSAVVSITIVSPVPVSITGASYGLNSFSFKYSSDPGLSYVVQSSSNLVTWGSMATNVATSNPSTFSDTSPPSPSRFYRVNRQSNL